MAGHRDTVHYILVVHIQTHAYAPPQLQYWVEFAFNQSLDSNYKKWRGGLKKGGGVEEGREGGREGGREERGRRGGGGKEGGRGEGGEGEGRRRGGGEEERGRGGGEGDEPVHL